MSRRTWGRILLVGLGASLVLVAIGGIPSGGGEGNSSPNDVRAASAQQSVEGCPCPTRLAEKDVSATVRQAKQAVDAARRSCPPRDWAAVQQEHLDEANTLWQGMSQAEKLQLMTLLGQSRLGNDVCFVIELDEEKLIPWDIVARVWGDGERYERVVHMTLGNNLQLVSGQVGSILDMDLAIPSGLPWGEGTVLAFLCYELEVVRIRAMIDCYCQMHGSARSDPYERVASMMEEINATLPFYTNKANQLEAYNIFMEKVRGWGLPLAYHASWLFEKIMAQGGRDTNKSCDLDLDYTEYWNYVAEDVATSFWPDIDAAELGKQKCECCHCSWWI